MTDKKTINYFIPPVVALTFLTRLPVSLCLPRHVFTEGWTKRQQGLSTLWYPLVGLLLAALLYGCTTLLPEMPNLLQSTIVVTLLVLLTGALHLDGLADSVDAACAAHGENTDTEKNKILRVFKDPTAGPMAVVSLILIIVLKIVLLVYLQFDLLLSLVVMLSLSRFMPVILLATTPYVREGGLGSEMSGNLPFKAIILLLVLLAIGAFILLPSSTVLWLMISLICLLFWWRQYWMKKIGGVVGDCLGALIELSEVTILLVLCLAAL